MLRNIYLAVGGVMLVGYLGWSVMGMEMGGLGKDPIPKEPRYTSSSSRSGGYYGSSRSSGGFFGGGFGK